MFHLAHCVFHRGAKVVPFFLVLQTPLPPLRHIDLFLIKAQVKAVILFSFLNRAFRQEWTGLIFGIP